jgi:hypothetical protein
MREYRLVEEKYPSYSLWVPEFKESESVGWIHFTREGRPYDRLILHNKSEALYYIQKDKERIEFETELPELIYHEIK